MFKSKNQNTRKECVNVILEFLAWKDYHPCSPKELLRSPPLNVLLNIWNFLFKLVDPNVHITKENMVTEVPKFYNEFGYPHTMKSSQLRTPTADHQWELNLVALSWLCKLLLYEHENFDKEFENKSALRHTESHSLNAASKTNIKNSLTTRVMTDLTAGHFQLYISGGETSRTLLRDFEEKLTSFLAEVQTNVNSKMDQLEKLRSNSLQVHKDIEEFENLKERVDTLSQELTKIEELTTNIKDYCMRLQRQLESSRELLEEETNVLLDLENKNQEINEIMKSTIDGNDLKTINTAIHELKLNLSHSTRKIKELDTEIPSLSSNITAMKHSLAKSFASVSKTCRIVIACMNTNGLDSSSWQKLDNMLKSVESYSLDDLNSLSDDCQTVVDDLVVTETMTFKNESEVRLDLTERTIELENKVKSLNEEITDLRGRETQYYKSSSIAKEKSHLISETDYLVSMIKANAKDEMEMVKRELENATADLQSASKRLDAERVAAKARLQKYVEAMKEVVERVENLKLKNCNAMRELIAFQRRARTELAETL